MGAKDQEWRVRRGREWYILCGDQIDLDTNYYYFIGRKKIYRANNAGCDMYGDCRCLAVGSTYIPRLKSVTHKSVGR